MACFVFLWVPASAGMTGLCAGNDGVVAGMTVAFAGMMWALALCRQTGRIYRADVGGRVTARNQVADGFAGERCVVNAF